MPSGTPFTFFAHRICSGARVAEVPFTKFRYVDQLNGAGSFDGTLPLTARAAEMAILEPGATMLCVDYGGLLVWAGIIWTVEVQTPANDYEVRVTGQGLWSYWWRRTVKSRQNMNYATGTSPIEIIWTGVDQFRIVLDCLANASSIAGAATVPLTGLRFNGPGAGGLSGITRTKTVYTYERKVIGQLIDDLSKQTQGFDYGINVEWDASTPPKPRAFVDLYWPRRGRANAQIALIHGSNAVLSKLVRDAYTMANPLTGIGSGTADAQLFIDKEDASYRYPAGPYPYYEDELEYPDWGVEYDDNLARLTQAKLSQTRAPITTATIEVIEGPTTPLGSIGLGDTVRAMENIRDYTVDQRLRIMAHTIDVSTLGLDTWTVDVAPEDATLGV